MTTEWMVVTVLIGVLWMVTLAVGFKAARDGRPNPDFEVEARAHGDYAFLIVTNNGDTGSFEVMVKEIWAGAEGKRGASIWNIPWAGSLSSQEIKHGSAKELIVATSQISTDVLQPSQSMDLQFWVAADGVDEIPNKAIDLSRLKLPGLQPRELAMRVRVSRTTPDSYQELRYSIRDYPSLPATQRLHFKKL